jgi:diadenosine tetraphosphate (Ap4A) HIT family hydrolase
MCPFCQSELLEQAVAVHGSVFAVKDRYPVAEGHVLVITRRHSEDFFSMTPQERQEADELLLQLRAQILQRDKSVRGFNVGANCGAVAGQKVPHAHIHLIPRREGDTQEPTGGVRGAVPGSLR